jgi:hypothetical protein
MAYGHIEEGHGELGVANAQATCPFIETADAAADVEVVAETRQALTGGYPPPANIQPPLIGLTALLMLPAGRM